MWKSPDFDATISKQYAKIYILYNFYNIQIVVQHGDAWLGRLLLQHQNISVYNYTFSNFHTELHITML
jgi:hypothetical protein